MVNQAGSIVALDNRALGLRIQAWLSGSDYLIDYRSSATNQPTHAPTPGRVLVVLSELLGFEPPQHL